jgi:hypothetical protein
MFKPGGASRKSGATGFQHGHKRIPFACFPQSLNEITCVDPSSDFVIRGAPTGTGCKFGENTIENQSEIVPVSVPRYSENLLEPRPFAVGNIRSPIQAAWYVGVLQFSTITVADCSFCGSVKYDAPRLVAGEVVWSFRSLE